MPEAFAALESASIEQSLERCGVETLCRDPLGKSRQMVQLGSVAVQRLRQVEQGRLGYDVLQQSAWSAVLQLDQRAIRQDD